MGIPFEGVKEITPLDSNTTINTTNKTTVCVSITTYYNHYLCDEGVVQSPETCDYTHTTESTETSCETLSDGTGGNINSTVFYTNPSSGGGGTTGGNDSNYDGSDPNIHGNGGTPINTAPIIEEEINDPCTNASPAIANANTLFNSPEVQQGMNDVLIQKINEEGRLPFIDQSEWGVAIGQSGTTLNVTAPRRGSATQGSIPSSQVTGNYIADGHSHPNWGYADPSALDLYGMLTSIQTNTNLKYRFVFGVSYPSRQTVDTYVLIVTDSNAAQTFLNQFPEIQNTNASTHDFKEDTKLGDDYFKAKDLSYVGYSQNLTDELYIPGVVGLAYILDKYNAGICIAKKDTNGNFKKNKCYFSD